MENNNFKNKIKNNFKILKEILTHEIFNEFKNIILNKELLENNNEKIFLLLKILRNIYIKKNIKEIKKRNKYVLNILQKIDNFILFLNYNEENLKEIISFLINNKNIDNKIKDEKFKKILEIRKKFNEIIVNISLILTPFEKKLISKILRKEIKETIFNLTEEEQECLKKFCF
ncbi:MAG: hypothetical protein N2114_06050 [Candidatus Goldbacteria bacterium]|nr:hypothetical protein [Candidatus Goldiibacteriota bacterium]